MIESTANPTIKSVRRLHHARHRKTDGKTLVEGPNGREALRSSLTTPMLVLALPEDHASIRFADESGVEPTLVTQRVLDAASDTQHAVGPVAVIEMPDDMTVRTHNTIALVDISDPGNVGTMIRTAVGFGFDVGVYGATADPWSPKAIRAAAATTLTARIARGSSVIADAATAGLESIALVVQGGDAIARTDGESMLIVGSEAHGLDREIVAGANRTATIAVDQIESLNAATAAAIAMYSMSALP